MKHDIEEADNFQLMMLRTIQAVPGKAPVAQGTGAFSCHLYFCTGTGEAWFCHLGIRHERIGV
ncbi:MAG TPA: hypothetical protein VN132_08230, partial [Bdellovibrio sp.]|nr:hypothetical protein [Bdellovibrio sp.]